MNVGEREVARVDLGLDYQVSVVDSVMDEHSDEEHSHTFFTDSWEGAMTAVRWLAPKGTALTGANLLTDSRDHSEALPASSKDPLAHLAEMELGGRWLGPPPPRIDR